MKKFSYKEYFVGKKITIMGLGLLGRGLGVAKFLAECGAEIIITDLKKEEELKSSIKKLNKFKNIKYVLGEHRLDDFKDRDMVIKSAGVPLDSIFIAEAKKNGIPVEMDASLFARLASGVKIIGVTGTRGKSTVTHLIYEILKNYSTRTFLGGNVKGTATLPLLKKAVANDIVVMELDSWQLQGFGEAGISPEIAVFTTFLPDHLNYYKGDMEKYFSDKANIYRNQKEEDILFMRPKVAKFIGEKDHQNIKGDSFIVDKKLIPKNWKIKLLGEHNLENIALAIAVAMEVGVPEKIIKKTVENFKGVPGRLELVREVKGIKFYNDTTATTPDGVIAGMDSLKNFKGKIILIGGGADKNLEYKEYAEIVPKFVKNFILFSGVATDKIKKEFEWRKKIFFTEVGNMKDALKNALMYAKKGDVVLLSPGAASFGIFKNEFDRGEQFDKLVSKI